ncbi:MAG: zinc-ribbon domain containing protein [Candidatus Paraimprobicoccus trichonymphae]|uniref:Zinc-ribbon domain containing protein n=1 Tax=Candidatus Paraimprobicoccus trichonymphae TaxID=3033793 RepID=A0AA48KZ20_9FIRM|nr:MAG: zinc-ribbon domain containing protein [Candidatus Paraimprobicoccus trichonymphae]
MSEANNDYEDKVLRCVVCGEDFVFSAGEQSFYAERGFENEPKKCRECREADKAKNNNNSSGYKQRKLYDTTCALCHGPAKVPFVPVGNKDVYCSECFQKKRAENNDSYSRNNYSNNQNYKNN